MQETLRSGKTTWRSVRFYKIAYDPKAKDTIAFIMPNQSLNTEDMPIYIVRIRDVEAEAGLNFLSNLDREEQDRVETKVAAGIWHSTDKTYDDQ